MHTCNIFRKKPKQTQPILTLWNILCDRSTEYRGPLIVACKVRQMSVEHRPTARLIKLLQFPQICILVETRIGLSYFTSERTCDILRPKMRLPSCQVLPGCDLRHCNIASRFLVNHRSLRRFRKKSCYKSKAGYEYHYKRSIFVLVLLAVCV